LDYPNYEVLVIDNNTPDESIWRAIEEIVERMGPPFRYLHLDKWPGYQVGCA
jgi:glycosyltransferase involved in cell wall biosynthesis